MLSDAALARKVADQAAQVNQWAALASARIASGLGDAEAHALKALTASLRAAPDGRATLAKARRNPSFMAAKSRIDELAVDLAKLVRHARCDFYATSFAFWRDHLPADIHRTPDPWARKADLARIESAVIHGMTPERWIAGPIATAKRSLDAKVGQAGSRAIPDRDGVDLLRAWRRQSERSIVANIRAGLVDSATLADRKAGRDVVHPDLLHPDPTLPD